MEILTIIIYIVLFISGSVFGSFFSLAIYRLPRKENITYVRSHCTTCNHKLNFWDLIPIWSYLFLGGKCRYCKEKIRNRYILLETFSGIVFLLIALFLKISAESTIYEFINLFFIYLFLCAIFIIGGIDNETKQIHDGTLLYGVIVALCYGLFKAIIYSESMKYNLIGFLVIPFTFLFITGLINYFNKKENAKIEDLPIGFGDIKYIALIGLFMGFGMQVMSLILAVIIGSVMIIKNRKKEIPLGYYLSISSAILLVFSPYIFDIAELINITMF